MLTECCVVDNRIFLLGLDKLYCDAMKKHERGELLGCARRVAEIVHATPADVPVEGYHAEDDQLTEYFRLIRALQEVDEGAVSLVASLTEFQRLRDVVSAPLYGSTQDHGTLLPTGRDALSQALLDSHPEWTLAGLTAAAFKKRETPMKFRLLASLPGPKTLWSSPPYASPLFSTTRWPLDFLSTRQEHGTFGMSMKTWRTTRGDSSTPSTRSLASNYHRPTRGTPSAIGSHATTMRSLVGVFGSGMTIRFLPFVTITGPSVVPPTESSWYRSSGNSKCGQPPNIVRPSAVVGNVLLFKINGSRDGDA